MLLVLDAGEDVFGDLGALGGVEEVEVGCGYGEAEFETLEVGEASDDGDEGRSFGTSVAG